MEMEPIFPISKEIEDTMVIYMFMELTTQMVQGIWLESLQQGWWYDQI